MFQHPTFVVLEVPEPMAGVVRRMRERFDAVVAGFVVEFTVIGSSGVGTLARDQHPALVYATLAEVAQAIAPFDTQFLSVERFPDSDVFYLAPRYPERFVAVQDAIVATGLRFDPNPYAFVPHCTLRSHGPLSPEDAAALYSLDVPHQPFVIDTLAVYELIDQRIAQCHFTTRLAGA